MRIARKGNRSERFRARLTALLRHEGGVSAIEFALFAPFLAVGFLSMVDLGFAIRQRMNMDHVLRAGAQSAMTDPADINAIKRVLAVTAAETFTVGTTTPINGKPVLAIDAKRYCVCPADPGAEVACSTICTGSVPTRAYYSLKASGAYSGIFLPKINFSPAVQVQVR